MSIWLIKTDYLQEVKIKLQTAADLWSLSGAAWSCDQITKPPSVSTFRLQKASMCSASDIYCTRWCTAGRRTASHWTSSRPPRTPPWVCITTLIWIKHPNSSTPCLTPSLCSVSVLQSILSADACKSGMPTVPGLIQTPWVQIRCRGPNAQEMFVFILSVSGLQGNEEN